MDRYAPNIPSEQAAQREVQLTDVVSLAERIVEMSQGVRQRAETLVAVWFGSPVPPPTEGKVPTPLPLIQRIHRALEIANADLLGVGDAVEMLHQRTGKTETETVAK